MARKNGNSKWNQAQAIRVKDKRTAKRLGIPASTVLSKHEAENLAEALDRDPQSNPRLEAMLREARA